MTIKIPVLLDYDGKNAQFVTRDLGSIVKSYAASAVSATAFVSVLKDSVGAALQDEHSQRQLAIALRNTAGANNYAVSKAEDYISSLQQQFGIADDELRPALAKLATVTKDVTEAQNLLQTALDISAFTGKDLGTVTATLQRAYQGNIGSLRRLGLSIGDGVIKSKDFAGAMAEVEAQTRGAAQTIADSAEGSFKKLQTNVDELKETLGREAIPRLEAYAKAGNAAIGWIKENESKGWFQGIIGHLTHFGEAANKAATAQEALNSRNATSAAYAAQWAAKAKAEADAAAEVAAAKKKAAEEAARLAAANRDKLASALQTAKDKLDAIKTSMTSYAASIRDAVLGYVNLSDAVSAQTTTEDAYNKALEDRRLAYEQLAKLQGTVFDVATGKTTVADAEDLAAAMERVAKAETAVTTAQAGRKSYTQAFSEQIAAAKTFATDLKTLIDRGLQASGVQQLLNLGPIAGAAVAKDLLSGTAGLTVSSLNANLSEIAALGMAAGTASGMGIYGADLLSAQNAVSAVGQAQNMNVTINATSADPDKIVAAIVAWSKKNGKLPSVIKVS